LHLWHTTKLNLIKIKICPYKKCKYLFKQQLYFGKPPKYLWIHSSSLMFTLNGNLQLYEKIEVEPDLFTTYLWWLFVPTWLEGADKWLGWACQASCFNVTCQRRFELEKPLANYRPWLHATVVAFNNHPASQSALSSMFCFEQWWHVLIH